jgi:CheY-like chemotaxis protein
MAEVVLAYRCGAAPESHRVPFSLGANPEHQRNHNVWWFAPRVNRYAVSVTSSDVRTLAAAAEVLVAVGDFGRNAARARAVLEHEVRGVRASAEDDRTRCSMGEAVDPGRKFQRAGQFTRPAAAGHALAGSPQVSLLAAFGCMVVRGDRAPALVFIRLPIGFTPAGGVCPERTSVPPRRISVIEDDENIAGLLEFMLRVEGFAPSIFRDGRAALQHVRDDRPPDAVVLDHMLPYCDGLSVASAMRADPRWSAVPILLLRSCATPAFRDARLVDECLTKPFDPGALVANLKKLVENAP